MEEAGAGDVGDRRAHLLPGMDDIDPESIDGIPPAEVEGESKANGTGWTTLRIFYRVI